MKRAIEPIDFDEVTNYLGKPAEWTEEQECGTLPCWVGAFETISCWDVPPLARVKLLLTGRLWFGVYGGMPSMWLASETPFVEQFGLPINSPITSWVAGPVWVEAGQAITCWKIPWRSRLQLLRTGRLWVGIRGGQPPIWFGIDAPGGAA